MRKIKILVFIINVLAISIVNAQNEKTEYYEPELLMVSQPKMEFYTANDEDYVQFYYDLKNIGSDTYKGDFVILMEPDIEHYYVKKSIKVKSGEIKRIKMEMDLSLIYYDSTYSVLPVYEFENQWYPLTAYEQFEPLSLCLNAPMSNVDYVVTSEPEPVYEYYYEVRLQRPPVFGYYYVTPPVGWAYAYGYHPCCHNNYVIFNGNNFPPPPPPGHNNDVPNVNRPTSAPRVSGNRYHNSASSSVSGSSSRKNNDHNNSGNVSTNNNSSSRSTSSPSVTNSNSRSSALSTNRNSTSQPTTTNSSRRPTSNGSTKRNKNSSTISPSSSSSNPGSSSRSLRSSSSRSSRSGGGRR